MYEFQASILVDKMDIGVEDNKKKRSDKIYNDNSNFKPDTRIQIELSATHKEALQNKLQKGTQYLKAGIL